MAKENFLAPGPKQSDFDTLSSTVSTLNSKITALGNLARSDDANALHTNAGANEFYRTVLSANATGSPNASNAFYLEGYKISDNYGFQNAYDTTNGYEYTREKWGSSTWSAWVSLNSNIIYEDISGIAPDEAISAGTPGTRGAQKIIPYNCPTGYTPSSVIVTYANNSIVVHPFAFFSNVNLYVNWYRAVATAIDTGSATINLRLTYVKS